MTSEPTPTPEPARWADLLGAAPELLDGRTVEEVLGREAPAIIRAPFTPEQVEALNAFQWSAGMHPFTCGGEHVPGSPLLVARADGWHCTDPYGEDCDYRQDWAHPFMADPEAWPTPFHWPSDRTKTGPIIETAQVGAVAREDSAGDPCPTPCPNRATLAELESRQRSARFHAGLCPRCGKHERVDDFGLGRLCDACISAVRKFKPWQRRVWDRYRQPSTGQPIQGSGYTPAELLGIGDAADGVDAGNLDGLAGRSGGPAADLNDDADLTAEEARDLATDLGRDLYLAQDALAFVGEMCDIADREGLEQVPVTRVREWLEGAKCGRLLLAGCATGPDLADWNSAEDASYDAGESATPHPTAAPACTLGPADTASLGPKTAQSGAATVTVTVHAGPDSASRAAAIADLITAEFGQGTRLEVGTGPAPGDTRPDLRERYEAALRAAAHVCGEDCDQPDDRACHQAHPVQEWVSSHGVVTGLYGPIPAIAAVVMGVRDAEMERLAEVDEQCDAAVAQLAAAHGHQLAADGTHHYFSTGCLHGEHAYCQGGTGRVGAKKPSQCKFCAAPCRCECHRDAPPADRTGSGG